MKVQYNIILSTIKKNRKIAKAENRFSGQNYKQTRQPPIQSEKYKCRIVTVSYPDDGYIVAKNMYEN